MRCPTLYTKRVVPRSSHHTFFQLRSRAWTPGAENSIFRGNKPASRMSFQYGGRASLPSSSFSVGAVYGGGSYAGWTGSAPSSAFLLGISIGTEACRRSVDCREGGLRKPAPWVGVGGGTTQLIDVLSTALPLIGTEARYGRLCSVSRGSLSFASG